MAHAAKHCAGLLAIVVAVLSGSPSAMYAGHANLTPEGVIGEDDRIPMDTWERPWNSVGKVHAQKGSRIDYCSATLIAPKVAVTVAHCLHNRRTGKQLRPSAVHFLAGYRKEKYVAHSVAECLKINPAYQLRRKPTLESVSEDFAFIILKKSMNVPTARILEHREVALGDRLVHAGYCCDRKYLLSVHDGCEVKHIEGTAIFTDCDTADGASGGPVFLKQDGEHYLAAVMSSTFNFDDNGKGLLNTAASIQRGGHDLEQIARCE